MALKFKIYLKKLERLQPTFKNIFCNTPAKHQVFNQLPVNILVDHRHTRLFSLHAIFFCKKAEFSIVKFCQGPKMLFVKKSFLFVLFLIQQERSWLLVLINLV